MLRRLVFLVAAATVAIPAASRAAVIDQGSYKIYRNDRALGAETFDVTEFSDSLFLRTRQFLTIQTPDGDEIVERGADVYVSRIDYSLRQYLSTRVFRGVTTRRAITMADTHYVAFREDAHGGEGESRVLPPGRLYIMDSQLVALFDLICRSFHAKRFESRPLNLLALGPRDTLLDARAVVLPSETIRWGAKPVVARRLQIVADAQTTFTLWVGPQGQMLRLSEPVGGLRAERDPPDVRPRAAQGPKSGG
jgi:hypothetical protein